MTVYEMGIIYSGVPLVYKSYDQGKRFDPVLRSGFITALNTFASEAFSDEIEAFSMKKYNVVMLSHQVSQGEPGKILIIYAIGDKKLNKKVVTKALKSVLNAFLTKYVGFELTSIDNRDFEEFEPVFDEIMGDITKDPRDRLRSVF